MTNNLTQKRTVEKQGSSNTANTSFKSSYIRYKGWSIGTKVIDGQLWIRWQHPAESFPRYNHPVREKGLAETIRYVRFVIDMAIKLEQEAARNCAYTDATGV